MKPSKTIAGILAGTSLVMGGVDASNLKEVPLERVEMVAQNRVEAKQIGNVVETTLPWKDQAGIKVKYDLGEPTLAEKVKDKRKKEVITETVTDFEGGFKVDILLNEKPDTNVFCYTIEGAENYDFFYQPPLTPEEIAEGASRPPEIEGSYAVYHKTLKNHIIGQENYATGKVMHIPRPQVWEIGNEESTKQWADLSYENGQLCVTAPQDFLEKADYTNGVRIDPTFGYTSAGVSFSSICNGTGSGNQSVRIGSSATSTTGGNVESLSISGVTLSGTHSADTSVFINTVDSVSSGSHGQVVFGEKQNLLYTNTQSWLDITASGLLNPDTNYVLSASCNDDDLPGTEITRLAYDTLTSNGYYSEGFGGGGYATSQENPWTDTVTDTSRTYSIYATYFPSPHGIRINNGTIRINNGTLDI